MRPRSAIDAGVVSEMYSGRAALVKSTIRVGRGELLVKGPDVGDTVLVVSLAVVE